MSTIAIPNFKQTKPTKERALAQLVALLAKAGGQPTEEGLTKVFREHWKSLSLLAHALHEALDDEARLQADISDMRERLSQAEIHA